MQSENEWFHVQLRAALNGLYNPQLLRKNPLVVLLKLEEKRNPSFELQSILLDAIESLRPGERAPTQSEAWRLYQILRRRYSEQVPQNQVAADLSLSIRQLQREESSARDELGDYLYKKYDLAGRVSTVRGSASEEESIDSGGQAPSRVEEMEYLKTSLPSQEVQLGQVIDDMLDTIAPLVQSSQAVIDYEPVEDLPPVYLQAPLLRQALLIIMSALLSRISFRRILIRLQVIQQTVQITMRGLEGRAPGEVFRLESLDELNNARQLIELCAGSMDIQQDEDLVVGLRLPAIEQALVLVIDDNLDTLQLYRRYLAGSHYRIAAAHSAAEGLEFFEKARPQLIVLDVMMPEQDGWRLLSQLSQKLGSKQIPIIICSILPQENLALALGAAEFLRKPVSRTQFLSALDRHLKH